MHWFLLCLGLTGTLGAQTALRILAVERRGLPPYEASDRVYRLDGGQDHGLRVGSRLVVRRTGEVRTLGQLWVIEVHPDQAIARFEAREALAPMKGDFALPEERKGLPSTGLVEPDRLSPVSGPLPTPEAPPREGILFFLPQQAELSRAGLKKLEGWVEQWGVEGRWAIQVPTARALTPALQQQRAEVLLAALRALGIQQVKLETGPRTAEGKYDPTWIRHWD